MGGGEYEGHIQECMEGSLGCTEGSPQNRGGWERYKEPMARAVKSDYSNYKVCNLLPHITIYYNPQGQQGLSRSQAPAA